MPEIRKQVTFLEVINKPIIYKFFKDFTNHKSKTNMAVVLSRRSLPDILKGCVLYIFPSLFCKSKTELFRNKEKCFFYFTSKALFVLEIIKFLTYQIFKCHDVIKCLSMKHETHFTK